MMWSEKYRPKHILDLIGNEEARKSFVEWFAKWKKGVKPLLLVGPPGIGKTTLANLSSKHFGYDLISLNASDVRNKNNIQEILQPVLDNQSVLGLPMIFIDEVDGIHGRSDYGGVEALINILKESTVPIILAANNHSTDKMKKIKKSVTTIELRPLSPRLLLLHMNRILQKENAKINPGKLIKLIIDSNGDIRSMINSAQALVTGFEPPTEKSFESLDVEEGINAFYKAQSIDEARSILYSMHIDPREKINAFYSSVITSKLSPSDLEKFLSIISEADILYGKIMRTQQWRLLRYLDAILLGLYKNNSGVRYSKYNLSWPLLNRLRWDGSKIKSINKLLATKMHVSSSIFSTIYFPYMLFCIKNNSFDLEFEETFDEIIEKEIELLK